MKKVFEALKMGLVGKKISWHLVLLGRSLLVPLNDFNVGQFITRRRLSELET